MHNDSFETQRRRPPDEEAILFELYHENSKQRRHDLRFAQRIYLLNSSATFHRVAAGAFKHYPGAEFTPLPAVEAGEGTSFERVAARRRSVRRFTGAPLRLDELARLAYFGNGITGRIDTGGGEVRQPVRAAPSGGALYPVEMYAAVIAVDGLPSGLYHYAVDRHGMELLRPGGWAAPLSAMTSDEAVFSKAAVAFVLTGVVGRSHFKYAERAYRFALLETGHICQNILLTATALGLGAVAVGGFIDDEVNDMLGLDGLDEASVYVVAVGRPAPRPVVVGDETAEGLVDRLLVTLSTGGATGARET
jgi:SagB-type dehydrogenase family enzyme